MTDRKEKFTPGPWKRALNMSRGGTGKPRGKSISRVVDSAGGVVAFMRPRKRQVANLLLIAAAPEMYEMLDKCEGCIRKLLDGPVDDPVVGEAENTVAEIRECLKKARGEE